MRCDIHRQGAVSSAQRCFSIIDKDHKFYAQIKWEGLSAMERRDCDDRLNLSRRGNNAMHEAVAQNRLQVDMKTPNNFT